MIDLCEANTRQTLNWTWTWAEHLGFLSFLLQKSMLWTPLLFRFAGKGVETDSQRCGPAHHGAGAGVLDLLVSHACSKLSQVQCPTAQVPMKCALGNTKQC